MNPFKELCGDVSASGVGYLIVCTLDDGDSYFLEELYIHNTFREHGHGTYIMDKVTEICDNERVDMELEVMDAFGSDISRLIDFYSRFGFRLTGDGTTMRRAYV